MITARITMVGFFALVWKRGSVRGASVGDGVEGMNFTAVLWAKSGDGVWENLGGKVALGCPIGVFVGV